MRFRSLILAAIAALGIGALSQLPAAKHVIAQGFEFIARDGNSNGPTVRGQTATSGLYFNSKGTGLTRHMMGGAPVTANLPVLSSCGTSPSLATGSSDFVGKVTVGTTASNACTLTFGTAYNTAPVCVVQNLTTGAAANVYSVSTTAITWSSALADSTVLHYHCIGLDGG